jgi:hypothetical protein
MRFAAIIAAFALCAQTAGAAPGEPRLAPGEWRTVHTTLAFDIEGRVLDANVLRATPVVWSECIGAETVGAFLNRQTMDDGRTGSTCMLREAAIAHGAIAAVSECVDPPTGGRREVRMRGGYTRTRIEAEMDMTGTLPGGPMSGRWRLVSERTGSCRAAGRR